MRIFILITVSFLAATGWPVLLHAQMDETKFLLHTKENGLSDNRITGIIQDHKGFIWIGTRKGLNRFDGNNFTRFLHSEKRGSLPDNYVIALRYLRGTIAVATSGGAQLIDASSLQTKNLVVQTDTSLYYWSNNFRDISLAANGYYISSTKTGLYAFDRDGQLKTRFDQYTAADVGKAWMLFGQANNRLPDGSILLQVEKGFLHYEPGSQKFIHITSTSPKIGALHEALPFSNIHVYVDEAGNIFHTDTRSNELVIRHPDNTITQLRLPFSLTGELGWKTQITKLSDSSYAMTGFSKGFYIIAHQKNTRQWSIGQKLFAGKFCSYVFADAESRLWIGTDEGLLQQQTTRPAVRTLPAEVNGHRINTMWCNTEKVFAGCYSHHGLMILDKKTGHLEKEIRFPDKSSILTLIPIHPDTLWVATDSSLRWMHIPSARTGLFPDSVNRLLKEIDILGYFRDSRGDLWLSNNGSNIMVRYHAATRRFSIYNANEEDKLLNINQAFGITEDRYGNIWLAGDGLCRWNRKLQRCDTLIKYFSAVNSLKNAMCVSFSDHADNLWFHIADNGIMKFNPFTKLIRRFTTSNGMADNSIRYIVAAGSQTAALTDEGISLVNSTDNSIINYFPHDGMQNPGRYRLLYYDETENTIYAAGENIISTISLDQVATIGKAPQLVIQEMIISGDSSIHYPGGMIRLGHLSNDLSFSFAGISFTEAGHTRYAWRFKDSGEEKWNELGKQNEVHFNNLRPGNYLLEIKAYAANNKWPGQVTELSIEIRPPWWQTTWFRVGAGILIASILVLLYRLRIQGIRKKSKLNEQLAEYEMKALHAQMNPHFVFNCLNSIKYMILHDQKENASHYLNLFAKMIRQTLEQSKQGIVSLDQEREYLRAYLEMEELRFNQSFRYSIRIDDQLNSGKVMIPSMLIQPLAENAIWHGLMNKQGDKQLHISFSRDNGHLTCTVEDNGIGIQQKENAGPPKAHRKTGLDNIRQRLELLNKKFNLSGSMVIYDLKDSNGKTGTRIKIVYPVLPE